MRSISIAGILFIMSSFISIADIYDDICNAIRTGNSKQLVTYISANIDLTITSQEAVYSKAQAEQIIRDFFTRNPPKSFTLLHKGSSKEGIQYAIGTLATNTGKTFRTSFYFKHSGNIYTIKELRFETE